MADRQALGQFSGLGFSRSIVVPMSGLVIATVLLMPAFALVGAYRQSVIAVESSTQLTETALRAKQSMVAPGASDAGTSIAMRSSDGGERGRVTWTPETLVYDLLGFHLPLMAGSLAVFAVFAFLVLRHVRRSATELETSARAIEGYARTLEESEARFRDVAEASSDWIWECDGEMRLVYLSSRFTEITGLADASALGQTIEQFFVAERADQGWRSRSEALHSRDPFRDLRCRYHDARGEMRVCRLAGRPMVDAAGAFAGYRGAATDITREVEVQARATHLALHDALTGLPNRVLFHERLDLALENDRQEQSRIAVLCLDLDHFKQVNDTLGHAAGDVLLQEVASRLKACILPSDTVARLGGDEFAVVQNGVNQPLEADALSRRIIESLNRPYAIEGQELHVGVSVGIAFADAGRRSPDVLLKNADIALYRAKQAGRGTVRVFEERMDLELQARRALEYDLRQALSRNQLELHYQPLVDLEGGHIVGVEALARWRHPEHGPIPPDSFIPLAEDTGLIVGIGEWILRTACRQATQWPDGLHIAVNLSPAQFRHRGLVDTVRQVLADAGLAPGRLELEITESVLLHDAATAKETLMSLKKTGVHIVMDDFGTGYSSLGYLNSFPFDKIKIDKSFISALSVERSNAIVRSVIGLGRSLDMIITAEGVETAEQAAFLSSEGCAQVQGYHFGRPLPADDMSRLIEGRGGCKSATAAA